MKDIRRTILWVIFAFSLVMLWDHWQEYNGRPATFFPAFSGLTAKTGANKPAEAPPATSTENPAHASVPQTAAAPATEASTQAASGATPGESALKGQQITVRTDVLTVVFDTDGGSVIRSEFPRFAEDSGSNPKQPFVLLETTPTHIYQAQSGLIGGPFPNHTTPMTFSGPRELPAGADEMKVQFTSADVGGVKLVKTYTLKRGSYVISVQDQVINESAAPVKPDLYLQFVRDGSQVAGATSFYSSFTGPAFYSEADKYQKVAFKDIDKGKAEFAADATGGYVAMVQHYFASAWLLAPNDQHQNFARKISNDRYAAGVITSLGTIAPGASVTSDARLFMGPQEVKILSNLAPGMDLVRDYGWLTILAKPLFWLLAHLDDVLGNWGWSIVALVVLLKIAFYWLNAKAYGSMAKMKTLNPKIQEMRKRLKDDPKQMQVEMMRIYREEKVNPLGGCLPIAVQMPVFIALYWVLLASVEMRGAPWILWVHDLSAKDPYFILPILMTLTTLLQTALNPAPPDPTQAKLMWIMPLAFSVMFFLFPSGLVLYYVTNNLLSIAQQWIINKRMGVPPSFHLPNFSGSKPKNSG